MRLPGLLELLTVDPLAFLLTAVALILAIAMHEFAHAAAADVQGDRLPRAMGRLTPNPMRHLDPLGTLLLFLVGFGWGKPVEFRTNALRSQRFGAALVALAGPLTNLLLATVGAFVYVLLSSPTGSLGLFFTFFIGVNVLLAVFNLVPLPPLDGSRLLTIFLPARHRNVIFFLDKYGFLILLLVVFFGGTALLAPIIEGVHRAIATVVGAS